MQQHRQQQSHQRHTTKRIKRQQTDRNKIWTCLLLSSSALLLTLWLVAVTHYVTTMISSSADDTVIDGGSSVQSALFNNERQPPASINPPLLVPGDDNNDNTTSNLRRKHIPSNTIIQQQTPKLLSRNPKVILTTSTRGNLGPPTVLNQNPPGKDWIKDRWQAASDMHGTAIKGSHWVLLDFSQLLDEEIENGNDIVGDGRRGVQMTKIVLDWETAYATDYRVEGRMDRPLEHDSSLNGVENDEWCVLYDGGNANNNKQRNNELQRIETQFHESSYGQSPGVKQKLPLHILHTIEWTTSSLDNNEQTSEGNDGSDRDSGGSCQTTTAFRYLRIFIRKPARGWGVSLWEVDVYGTIVNR